MRSAVYAAPALATLALAFASPAAAQSYGQPANAQPGYGQSGYGQSQNYSAPVDRPERAERSEAPEQGDPSQDLVRQLRLRGDQQAAYRDYQAAFQAQDQGDENQDDIARLAAMTTPQRLDDSARQMDRDRADFERVSAATRRFYATLDANQKRTFDRLTAPQAEPDGADTDDEDAPASNRPPPPRR